MKPDIKTLAKTTHSWDGSPLPSSSDGSAEVTILKITIPAGTRLEPHTHPMINAGYVMKGKLTVIAADGKECTFSAGDTIVEMVNRVHYGENHGSKDVELLMFYCGTEGQTLSIPS